MALFTRVQRAFQSIFRTEHVERQIDNELRSFMEESAAHKRSLGASREQAARAARIEMGSTNAVAHRIRTAGWETKMEILWKDFRHALRGLLRTPGFTIVALLSLALGIGANTAIFTLIQQVLLRNLPVRDPQQLVTFGPSLGGGVLGGIDLGFFDQYTYDFARQLEKAPGPFQGVASYSSIDPVVSVRISNEGSAFHLNSSMVSGNYFSVLGAAPQLGRTILPADAQTPGGDPVVVVSYRFWQNSLSSDPGIVGKTISLNGTPFTVVGIMPPGFHGIRRQLTLPDLWVPLTMADAIMLQPGMLAPRSFYFIHMFARRSLQSSLSADQQWLDRQMRDYVRAGEGINITPERQKEIERITDPITSASHGVSSLGDQYGASLRILMAVVVLVLVIACANMANFLLARAIARQRETATRLALGSSRMRIVRQSLMEALTLSLVGGMAGLALAFLATRALIVWVSQGIASNALTPRPDMTVLLFTLGVSLCAGILFGLAPAIRIAHTSAGPALTGGVRTASSASGYGKGVLPKILVTGQIVFSLLLLVGAGLFLRTLLNLQNQDYGFARTHLLLAQFDPQLAGYKPEQIPALNQQLLDRLQAIPGVRAAALSNSPPITFGTWRSSIKPSGYTPAPREDVGAILNRVSGHYFETAGISIVAGRPITPADKATTLKVCVVNQAIAEKYFPHGNAIGSTIKIDIDTVEGPWQIVGIAHDTRSSGPRDPSYRTVYLPLAQIRGKQGEGIRDSIASTILLRTVGDPNTAIGQLRGIVAEIDPNLTLLQVRTIQQQMEMFVSRESLIARLTVIFALLALLLACIGLYGVMSYSVTRRNGEIGIRIALGASAASVQRMILGESLVLLAVGIAFGLPLILASGRYIRSQLFELSPFDPLTLAVASFSIIAVTLFAAWLPARRAARVDPMTALRCE
ncbi:MAG TPA: ABC transporter permease [Terracidiphilus sp.]|nr:ABC transporter permease [Terracidiphilus sp.]